MPLVSLGMTSGTKLQPPRLTSPRGADQTFGLMRRGRLSTVMRGAVLIPLLVAAVSPDTIRTLVCRYTGVVMPEETCCPEPAAQDRAAPARLRDESCCVVKTIHLARLVSDRETCGAGPVHYEVAAGFTPTETCLVAVRAPSIRRSAILPVGPPILLVKQAFLI